MQKCAKMTVVYIIGKQRKTGRLFICRYKDLFCHKKKRCTIISAIFFHLHSFLRCPASQQKEPVRVNGQEVRFFTPVRRSVRIERASLRYPPSLQDHDVCVSSYNDLISEEGKEVGEEPSTHSGSDTPMYIYRQNEALGDKVSVELILDDSF